MAPIFYKLLTNVNNNWTLIKIVKLMGSLAPHEPRLAKKLVEPIANIIANTPAKSLLYECLITVTIGMKEHMTVVKLAVDKLKQFVEDKDQNLKYLGLAGLNNLMSKYPKVISDMKDTIMECLEDNDTTIRYRALDLLCGVVNQKNIKGIMSKLLKQLEKSEGDYRDYLVERIITTCSADNYSSISNFKWYLDILIQLTNVKSAQHGKLIAQHIMDVLIRVKSLRQHGVNEMITLLTSPLLSTESAETSSVFDVLYAASWTIGEFITQADVDYKQVLDKLLQPTVASLPDKIKACYVQAITKIYAAAASKGQKSTSEQVQDLLGFDNSTLESQEAEQLPHLPQQNNTKVDTELLSELRSSIRDGFKKYFNSPDVEVQERCSTCLALLDIHEELTKEGTDVGPEIESIFEDPLNPVLVGSQEKVPIPEGLDLDNWIGKSWELLVDESVFNQVGAPIAEYSPFESEHKEEEYTIDPNVPISNYQQNKEVFIIKSSSKPKKQSTTPEQKKPVKKTKKVVKKVKKHEEEIEEPMQVSTDFEQVEGYVPQKATKVVSNELEDALSRIDLTQPIGADELLPSIKAYPVGTSPIIAPKKKEEPVKKGTKKTKEAAEEGAKKKKVIKKKKTEEGEPEAKTTKKKKVVKKDSANELLEFFDEPKAEATKPTKKAPAKKKVAEKTAKPTKKGLKLLVRDDHIKVYYNTKVFPLDGSTLSIPITLENISDSDVNAISYNFDSTINLKFIRPGVQTTGPIRSGFSLAPESSNILNPSFTFQSFVRQQQVTGFVEYILESDQKHRLDFTMKVPSSMFFVQKRISVDEFANLIKTGQLPHLSSTNCTLNEKIGDVNTAAKEIARQLRLTVVDFVEDQVYQMYGNSCQGHHLAVLVKAKSATTVSVELKTADDNLSTSLVQEVAMLFKEK